MLSAFVAANAQQIRIDPRNVSREEVEMTQYLPDTTAAVVMLYRKLEAGIALNPSGALERSETITERWKVLKEPGKDMLDYELFYSTRSDFQESIGDIKVVTYNLDANGRVKQQKMSRSNIFRERYTEGVNRLTFAPEAVQVGSVVEVTFNRRSPSFRLGPYFLQDNYPVNLAEADIFFPEYFTYNHIQTGYMSAVYTHDTSRKSFNVAAQTFSYIEYHDVYRAINLPAMKDEPFSYCTDQYKLCLNYDLRSIHFPGESFRDLTSTWEKVDRTFVEADLIRRCTARFREKDALQAALADVSGVQETIVAVRNFVTDRVRWNGRTKLFPEEGNAVLRAGEGSGADINALVASALNGLEGFKAEPVLLKFRSNGVMLDYRISNSEFDTFILRVEGPGSQAFYLDAARPEGYLNVLFPNYLVRAARRLDLNGRGSWVNLWESVPASRTNIAVQMAFNEDGVLKGHYRANASNNDSFDMKNLRRGKGSYDAWVEYLEKGTEMRISEATLDQENVFSANCRLDFDFTCDNVVIGPDRIYVEPFLEKFHDENTFNEEQRIMPIDFPHPGRISYSCQITVPEGYEVEALPEPASLVCPVMENSSAVLQCQVFGNQIQLSYRFNLNSILVLKDNYQDLRLFWEQVAAVEKCVIVLRKI